MADTFTERVVAAVRSLPPGCVASYGELAAEAGSPRGARAVARILATSDVELPWWRVVTATGRLAPHKRAEQARRLAAEGVTCVDGRVRSGPADR